MKQQPVDPGTSGQKQSKNVKFRTYAYYLAWISFISAIGSAIYSAIKDHEPPKKDEYYK